MILYYKSDNMYELLQNDLYKIRVSINIYIIMHVSIYFIIMACN